MANIEELLHVDDLELLIKTAPWEFGPIPRELSSLRDFQGRENQLYSLSLRDYRSLRRAAFRGLRKWLRAQAQLHLLICVQFDYCKRREQPMAELAKDLSEKLAHLIPPPYNDYLAALLAKIDFLDAFCSCNVAKA